MRNFRIVKVAHELTTPQHVSSHHRSKIHERNLAPPNRLHCCRCRKRRTCRLRPSRPSPRSYYHPRLLCSLGHRLTSRCCCHIRLLPAAHYPQTPTTRSDRLCLSTLGSTWTRRIRDHATREGCYGNIF